MHPDPSSKPVGSVLMPAAKNAPCYTWALAPTGEHSFAFMHPRLPLSQRSDHVGKAGGEYQWIGVTAYHVHKFNEQTQRWVQEAGAYSVNEAAAVMRSYLFRWLLPRCAPTPDVRGGHITDTAPATTGTLRSVHEWCCSPTSLISSGCASDSRGCLCQRTTETEDGTTLSAAKRARCFLSRANSLLWSSMPCTGGASWQHINVRKPGGYARLRKHIRLFDKLWHRFDAIARHTHTPKGELYTH